MSEETTYIVWNWKKASAGEKSPVRVRYWVQVSVMTAAGIILFLMTDHIVLPSLLLALAALLLAGLLFSDRIVRGFDQTGVFLARAVGNGLTWLLLAPFFYVVFGTGRLVLRITGKDPLQLKIYPQASSYWTDRAANPAPSSIQRQF